MKPHEFTFQVDMGNIGLNTYRRITSHEDHIFAYLFRAQDAQDFAPVTKSFGYNKET